MNTAVEHAWIRETAEKKVWVGRTVSVVVVMFMLFDGTMKVLQEEHVRVAMAHLEWPAGQTVGLGLVLLACTLLYAIPRTAVLGAILLTGFLGGAAATHARLGEPSMFFAVLMGALAWLGVYLRDERVRALVPFR